MVASATPTNHPHHHLPRRGRVLNVDKDNDTIQVLMTTTAAAAATTTTNGDAGQDDDDKKQQATSTTTSILTLTKKEWKKRMVLNVVPTKRLDVQKPKMTIILTPETNFFRELAYQLDTSDRVLEIGCSTGETSRILTSLKIQSWVGLDTSEVMISKCRQTILMEKQQQQDDDNQNDNTTNNNNHNHNNYHVAKIDALVDPGKAYQEATKFGPPTVVFIDIGGNRECINVLRMLSWVLDTFAKSNQNTINDDDDNDTHYCRFIAIKSRELVQSIQTSSMTNIDNQSGMIMNATQWFHQHKEKRALPKHPLRAPLVLSPKDGITPICRYYNYHKNGCSKGDDCPLDHTYCHACQQLGHVAKECSSLKK